MKKYILASVLGAVAALAAPQLTTIQDTIYKADGTRFSGIVVINWKNFEAADQSNIGMQSTTVSVVNGQLFVQLVPTTNAATLTRYQVQYNSAGRIQFEETWDVPPSGTPLRVRDVRSSVATGTLAATPLQQTDIVGLTSDLAARPVKGASYAPAHVAFIDTTGALIAVLGAASDCIRADGTTGPCGSGGGGSTTATFMDAETPAGVADGSNVTFSLGATPNPPASLMVFRNGILQRAGTDFTTSGNAVIFAGVATPQAGDVLTASYRTSSGTLNFIDGEVPGGATDGNNANFTVGNAPVPASSLAVYRNGILQKPGVDYLLSGRTVQFQTNSIPQSGDSLLVFYRM